MSPVKKRTGTKKAAPKKAAPKKAAPKKAAPKKAAPKKAAPKKAAPRSERTSTSDPKSETMQFEEEPEIAIGPWASADPDHADSGPSETGPGDFGPGNDDEPTPFRPDWDDDLWGVDWDDLDPAATPNDHRSSRADSTTRRGGDGMEMFQSAALELIGAARNALDAAEELVADPHAIGAAFESVRGIATEVVRAASPSARHTPTGDGDSGDEGDDDDDGDFQRIRVSDD